MNIYDTCQQISMIMADLGYEPPRMSEDGLSAHRKVLAAFLDLQRRLDD